MEPLLDAVARLIAEHLETSEPARRKRRRGIPEEVLQRANAIAEDLVSQATKHGFEVSVTRLQPEPLGDGNTAQMVARMSVPLSFIFKLDDSPEVIEQARLLRRFREDETLPASFRERFPKVYALKADERPFAYLMEDFSDGDGYESLARRLFHPTAPENLAADSRRLVHQALDALLEAYAQSANRRLLPNISADYLDRIRKRMDEAAKLDEFFRPAALTINGQRIRSWQELVGEIAVDEEKLRRISPSFLCAVHGDPNPENIMLKVEGPRVTVKLIDPKTWERGDYLFDLTKVAHYLWANGPVERAAGGHWESPERHTINYSIERAPWIAPVVASIRERAIEFAHSNGDLSRVDLRWDLGMAANILGLPAGRWRQGRYDIARVLYAEGMVWLDRFCRGFADL